MSPNDIPQTDLTVQFAMDALQWLGLVVYLIGVGIAIWAFRRSHKCGYLVIAIYFAVAALWLVAAVPIWRAIHANDAPDISQQTQQKIDAAEKDGANRVLTEAGHPPIYTVTKRVNLPVGPVALVVGVWLLARRETQVIKS